MNTRCKFWIGCGTALRGLGAVTLLAPSTIAEPAAPSPAVAAAPSPAVAAAPSPAVAVVEQYLAAHLDGQMDRAYTLLAPQTQAQFPLARREQIAQAMTSPNRLRSLSPGLLPVVALFADIHNVLHFRFRALGPSPDDPAVVLVRAYQVGTPLSAIKILKVVTVADPGAGGTPRLDGEQTEFLAVPELRQQVQNARRAPSQSNLKHLALAVLRYAQDHDQKMPDADKWMDEITPYLKSVTVFHDSAVPSQPWGYAFNRALSGVPLSALADPAATVLLFESTSGKRNAADTGDSVPMPGRYSGGTDYALADGHVKWESDDAKPSFLLTGK